MNKNDELMNDMVAFTSAVMNHCHSEAKHSTDIVMNALSYITTNSKGIEIKEIENDIKASILNNEQHHAVISKVKDSINTFAEQDAKRQQLMAPILQQLQFQDYISQQMDVLIHMLNTWLIKRKQLSDDGEITQDDIDAFGAQLAALCVSEIEKEIIKKHIPSVEVFSFIAEDEDDLFF